MRVLFIGDIIGEPGRRFLKQHLKEIIKEHKVEFTIANAENLAGGRGLTKKVVEEVRSYGVDVLTTGNHVWDRKEVEEVINLEYVLRPANYPVGVPGRGYGVYEKNNKKISVINLMGRVYMPLTDCPFQTIDKILNESKGIKIVDFHAEITSEKQAMGWYLDGRVSAIICSHTHVQTADERILPLGSAYITDCGMVGGLDSIIGIEREPVIKKYLTTLPVRYYPAKGKILFNSVLIDIDEETCLATGIRRLNIIS